MAISLYQSEQMLAAAFAALFNFVASLEANGGDEASAPVFTYLLTPAQQAAIDRVCAEEGWPQVNHPGILIDVEAIRHPLRTRRAKDQITDEEIKAVITKSYSHRSIVRCNRHHGQQAVMLNTQQKVQVGNTTFYGMAILEIKTEGAKNYLAPVTCYHATEAKARAISR